MLMDIYWKSKLKLQVIVVEKIFIDNVWDYPYNEFR